VRLPYRQLGGRRAGSYRGELGWRAIVQGEPSSDILDSRFNHGCSMRARNFLIVTIAVHAAILHSQTLSLVSGHGQVIQEQSIATKLFVVRALDASRTPMANVPITWSVSPMSAGTLRLESAQTDSEGFASTAFFASSNQPGLSFVPATITARSLNGEVNFALVVSLGRQAGGGLVPLPLVLPMAPTHGATIEGTSGAVIPNAVQVKVVAQGGISLGQPIPNVGLRVEPLDPSAGPSASCNGPGDTVLTDQNGVATCDLVLNQTPGSVQMVAVVGEYWPNLRFDLRITQGPNCFFSIAPVTQSFSSAVGAGSVNVSAPQGCSWSATSNASWITVTAGATGQNAGAVNFQVAANTGGGRTGTLAVAGWTFTIHQAGAGDAGGGPLAFSISQLLPNATAGVNYSFSLSATGGTPPYSWESNNLPAGLTLNASTGILSGMPSSAGAYSFPVTLSDTSGSTNQTFTLTVSPSAAVNRPSAITTSSFPSGTVGVPYEAVIATSGGCNNPFSGPPQIALASGGLPPGLAIQPLPGGAPNGIAGTPRTPGTFTFVLRATACNDTTTRDFSITIASAPVAPPMTANPSSLSFTVQGARPPEQTIVLATANGGVAFTASDTTASGGNWLIISANSGTTPATLTAGIGQISQLAPGIYTGSISVVSQASNSPLRINVSLTVLTPAPPGSGAPTLSSVTNAASFATGPLAPGEFVTIFGAGLGPLALTPLRLTPAGRIDTVLAGTRVLFDDIPAPIIHTSAAQVTAIAPYALAGRFTTYVQVEYLGVRSAPAAVAVVPGAPGIFTLGGTNQGAISNQNGSVNDVQNGAVAGTVISIYATGEGRLMPETVEGSIAGSELLPRPVLPVFVEIGGQRADVLYAGAAPSLPLGVLQVNARVPPNIPRGTALPVVLIVDQAVSRPVTMYTSAN
jgi:uncharacterized protein (TIGR03437 family)